MMLRSLLLIAALLSPQAPAGDSSGTAHAAETGTPSPIVETVDTALESRARALNMTLRCPVCQSSSIQESPANQAVEMKAVVREKLAAGESEEQIRAYFVSKYGEWVLLDPPAHGFNLLVYLLPLALLIGGGAFVFRTARSWTRGAT